MIRHVVLLRFLGDDETAARTADAVVDALQQLPDRIEAIRSYRVERDLRLAPDNAHVIVTAEFDDELGHAEYTQHPDHLEVIEQLIRPSLDRRVAVQVRL